MAEETPGYEAALAAALHQANINALIAAENGDNQLGRPVPKHPGHPIAELPKTHRAALDKAVWPTLPGATR
jgi:hypothetical protein